MRYRIDHDYHIHSFLSSCASNPEQDEQYILKRTKELGLSRICITNHYWDGAVPGASKWYSRQGFDHIAQSLPLPQDGDVEFLFGCETDMDKHMTVGCPPSRYDDFDFIIIPTTHLHMFGFTVEEADDNVASKARLWAQRFDALLAQSLPFHKIGIAHLSTCLINWRRKSREEYFATLEAIDKKEAERLFAMAATRGCGIELNLGDMRIAGKDMDKALELFHIAKGCGCKFYLGSDAHEPQEFDGFHEIYEQVITKLDLTENDKFHIG